MSCNGFTDYSGFDLQISLRHRSYSRTYSVFLWPWPIVEADAMQGNSVWAAVAVRSHCNAVLLNTTSSIKGSTLDTTSRREERVQIALVHMTRLQRRGQPAPSQSAVRTSSFGLLFLLWLFKYTKKRKSKIVFENPRQLKKCSGLISSLTLPNTCEKPGWICLATWGHQAGGLTPQWLWWQPSSSFSVKKTFLAVFIRKGHFLPSINKSPWAFRK